MRTVYLAGPIYGCTQSEARDWRADVSAQLAKHFIKSISPLRCEPLIGDRYELTYLDPRFGTAKAIASKNEFDVRTCDLTLAYLPASLCKDKPSFGTVAEMAWAHILGKRVLLVSDHKPYIDHPVIQACASWILPTLDDAIDTIVGVLGDYARPL